MIGRRTRRVVAALGLIGMLAGSIMLPLNGPTPAFAQPGEDKERGPDKYDDAVAAGLKWLALHQAKDGHWGLNDFPKHARTAPLPGGKTLPCNCAAGTTRVNSTAGTALALLPFLAGGHTHKPRAGRKGPDYTKTVSAGLDYLLKAQNRDGSYDKDMYANALAALVVCHAYSMTSDPKMKRSAQRAVNFIVSAQDPTGGGWRYKPRQAGDLSVTGWYVSTLKTAQMTNLKIPRATMLKAAKFVDSCETRDKGAFAYVPGTAERNTMTAVGLLCRQYFGASPRNPALVAGIKRLKALPPAKSDNLYYEYYATQVMHHMGGADAAFWKDGPDGKNGILAVLLARQDTGRARGRTHQKGSWAPIRGEAAAGGRLLSTALALTTLQVRDGKLSLFRRPGVDLSR